MAAISATSNTLTSGKVAMKLAALLNGSGSLFSSKRLITKCTGRNIRRNIPARAMTNFFEIDANKILFIVY
jgi:hypothetical protein